MLHTLVFTDVKIWKCKQTSDSSDVGMDLISSENTYTIKLNLLRQAVVKDDTRVATVKLYLATCAEKYVRFTMGKIKNTFLIKLWPLYSRRQSLCGL